MKNKFYPYFFLTIAVTLLIACNTSNTSDSNTSKNDSLPKDLKLLNEQIAASPDKANLYYQRSNYFFTQKDIKNAAMDIDRAIKLDSTQKDFYLTKSDIYFAINRTSVTKACLEKAIALDSMDTDAILKLAELYLYVKMNEQSIAYVNKALRVNKHNAKAYFIKGINMLELRDTAKAFTSFLTTVEQDPEYYHAYIQLGILMAVKKDKLAVDYYNTALNLNPKSEEAHYNLGLYYLETKEIAKASEQFATTIQINPMDREAHYNLGFINYEHLKQYDKARKHFSDAVSADPKFARGYYMLGLSYEALGDKQNAKIAYSKSIELNPLYDKPKEGLKRVQ